MKARLLGMIAAIALVACAIAKAQSLSSMPMDGFVQHGKAYGVTAAKISQIKVWRVIVEGDALAGENVSDAKASAGLALVVPWQIKPYFQLRFGLADMLDAQSKPTIKGAGLYFGARVALW